MKKTVMFDMDGTLVPFISEEFLRLYFGGLAKKLAPLGYDPKKVIDDVWAGTYAMIKNDGSKINRDAFWEVFRAKNEGMPDAEPFCDDFYTKEFDATKACLKENRDLKPMMENLKAAGYDIILSTNSVFPLTAMLTRLGWINLCESDFIYITHYKNSSYCKPNPKYFTEILEKTGKSAADCIVVGNSVKEDIMPARSLGIKTFLVTEYMENPDDIDITPFDKGTIKQAEEFLLS